MSPEELRRGGGVGGGEVGIVGVDGHQVPRRIIRNRAEACHVFRYFSLMKIMATPPCDPNETLPNFPAPPVYS